MKIKYKNINKRNQIKKKGNKGVELLQLTGRSAPPDMLLQTKKIFERSILNSSIPIDLPRLLRKIEIKNELTDENICLEDSLFPDQKVYPLPLPPPSFIIII